MICISTDSDTEGTTLCVFRLCWVTHAADDVFYSYVANDSIWKCLHALDGMAYC